MSTVDFNAMLSKPANTAERPSGVPKGIYIARVLRHEFGTSKQKGTPYVRVFFSLQGPHAVDATEFEQWGGLPKLVNKEMHLDFYITDGALYRLTEFFEVLGLDLNLEHRELLEQIQGCECGVEITVDINEKDPTHKYSNISRVVYV